MGRETGFHYVVLPGLELATIDQAGHKLRDSSASQSVGIKVVCYCAWCPKRKKFFVYILNSKTDCLIVSPLIFKCVFKTKQQKESSQRQFVLGLHRS